MYILSDLHQDHRHSGILTDGNHILTRDLEILLKLAQNLPAQRRLLRPGCFFHRLRHITGQKMIGLDTHFLNALRDIRNVYIPYHAVITCPYLVVIRAAQSAHASCAALYCSSV